MHPARVRCPTCQRELEWQNAPFKPFCSERCRLVDLGAWLTEQRAIPEDAAPEETPAPSGASPPRDPEQ